MLGSKRHVLGSKRHVPGSKRYVQQGIRNKNWPPARDHRISTKSGLSVFYLDSGAGHDNVRRAKTRFSLVIVSVTFGLGNQQKPYDFKALLMISGDFSWPTGLPAGRLAVRLEASASRSVSLFRFLRQFLSDSLLYLS